MPCSQCRGIERFFDDKEAAKELRNYRNKGPSRTTQMLLDAIGEHGVEGKTLLDIGGGVGAIQHELLRAGADSVTSVEASSAYLQTSKQEAERQGHADRVSYQAGNFVDVAADVDPADVVTLDRVICCYHDVEALLGQAAEKAGTLLGLVHPRDSWPIRPAFRSLNLFFRLRKCPFRVYVHPNPVVQEILSRNGFRRISYRTTFVWQVSLYSRAA
jgi:magnesium-protoporphyrin O-methyltransferase